MDVKIGDILVMKKQHPCGSDRWLVTRVGADFKMKCLGCGHEVMNGRSKVERYIKRIDRAADGDGQSMSAIKPETSE